MTTTPAPIPAELAAALAAEGLERIFAEHIARLEAEVETIERLIDYAPEETLDEFYKLRDAVEERLHATRRAIREAEAAEARRAHAALVRKIEAGLRR